MAETKEQEENSWKDIQPRWSNWDGEIKTGLSWWEIAPDKKRIDNSWVDIIPKEQDDTEKTLTIDNSPPQVPKQFPKLPKREKVTLSELKKQLSWYDTGFYKEINWHLEYFSHLEKSPSYGFLLSLYKTEIEKLIWKYSVAISDGEEKALSKFSGELKTIIDKIGREVKLIKTWTRIDTSKLSDSVKDKRWWIKRYSGIFFKSESLKSIMDITIDEKVKSSEDFTQKMDKLINAVKELDEFSNLTSKEQQDFISFLTYQKESIKETKDKQVQLLSDNFNDLAKQVEKQWDSKPIVLNLWLWEAVKFKDKEEAFDFIADTKKEAEDEFEGFMTEFSEASRAFLLYFISSPIKPYTWTVSNIKNISSNLFDGEEHNKLERCWDWFITTISIIWTINYTETLVRRCIVDNLAKMQIVSIGGKKIRIPDFKTQSNYFTNDEEKAYLKNEYEQRIDALNKLEEIKWTLSGKDAEVFEREFSRVKTYLNINTDTFWLKAYSLAKKQWVIVRLWNAFRWSPAKWPTWLTLRDGSTRYFNLDERARGELEKWLDYVFDDTNLKIKDWKITWVEWWGVESDNIKNIKNYILSRTDISDKEKQLRIKRIDDFIKWLLTSPKWEDYVKRKLVLISKEWILSKGEIKAKIEKKLYEKYPFLKDKSEYNLTWGEKIRKMKQGIKEWYWKSGPASLTSWDSILFKVLNFVDNGLWEWTEEELQEVLDKSDKGQLEIRQSYKWKKIQFFIDFFTWWRDRYGFSIPELNKLKKFWKALSNSDLQDILDKGSSIKKVQESLKKIINSWVEIDWSLHNPIDSLSNYIKYILTNEDELSYANNLRELLSDVEKGNILYSELEFFREIKRVKEWYITTYRLIKKLEKLREKDWLTNLEKTNIDKFISEARKWNLDFSDDDFGMLESGRLNFDPDAIYLSEDFTEDNKKNLIRELEEHRNLWDYDYRNQLSWRPTELSNIETELFRKYKKEIDYLKIIAEIDDNADIIKDLELNLKYLARQLKDNNYTRWQVKAILDDIFRWISLTNDDYNRIVGAITDHEIEFSMIWEIRDKLKTTFGNLSPERKEVIFDFIHDNGIQDNDLPENIERELRAHRFEIGRAERSPAQKAWLSRLISEIEKVDNLEELKELNKEFNRYIREDAKDLILEEIEELREEFDLKLNEQKAKINDEIEAKRVEADKAEKVKRNLNEGKEMLNKYDENVRYLEDLFDRWIDDVNEWIRDYNSDFKSRWIDLELSVLEWQKQKNMSLILEKIKNLKEQKIVALREKFWGLDKIPREIVESDAWLRNLLLQQKLDAYEFEVKMKRWKTTEGYERLRSLISTWRKNYTPETLERHLIEKSADYSDKTITNIRSSRELFEKLWEKAISKGLLKEHFLNIRKAIEIWDRSMIKELEKSMDWLWRESSRLAKYLIKAFKTWI